MTVNVGEKVTIRIEESAVNGLLWSCPLIEGDGLQLLTSRSITAGSGNQEYREFVFTTHQSGRNVVRTSLKQAGFEAGVKSFFMVVDVLEPVAMRREGALQ